MFLSTISGERKAMFWSLVKLKALMKNKEKWIGEKEKIRATAVSATINEKLFLKTSLGYKRSKETILTLIKIGRKQCVKQFQACV